MMLNQEIIENQLRMQNFLTPYQFYLFDTVDSTNRFLKDLTTSNMLTICCTEMQTQGVGRFGRKWHSPYAENIYCSLRKILPCKLGQLSGLSLVISLSVVKVLSNHHISDNIAIKWPNDILWKGKKLAGILVELVHNPKHAEVIIGLGLNTNSDTLQTTLNDKAWCSMYEITGNFFDRNSLIAQLLKQIETDIQIFLEQGLQAFMPAWADLDYLLNQEVQISRPDGIISGYARGINAQGELLLEDTEHKIHALSMGESSLKPQSP
jgi:BirA family biotin operon repressor/biotin-[acetyl-CoA-carboxylase] ligase